MPSGDAAPAEFAAEERRFRIKRADLALKLGTVLMPAGAIPDWFSYREHFWLLLLVRLFVTAMLFLGLLTGRLWNEGRLFAPVSFFLILLPAVAICWMLAITNGSQSEYYFGLILLMIVVHLLGFRTSEATLYCVVTVVAYIVAVFIADGYRWPRDTETIQAIFFLAISASACILVCDANRRHRLAMFRLHRELEIDRERLRESFAQMRDTELKLIHSEKMRAVAGIAAGLLHEINTPVHYSLVSVDLLKKRLAGQAEASSLLSDIEHGVSRIGELVTDMRSFANPNEQGQHESFLLTDAIRISERFLTYEISPVVVAIADCPAMSTRVTGSKNQIVHVLLNIIQNASDSYERNQSDSVELTIDIDAEIRDDRLFVTVSDGGGGMSEDQLRQATTPFFTTKIGKGLGLGLSVCDSIIRSHGGRLRIESRLRAGTQVTFDLPLAPDDPPGE